MKKTYLLSFLFFCFFISASFAQYNRKASTFEYNHGFGANLAYINMPITNGQGIIPAIYYVPRFNFVRFSADATFAIKTPVAMFVVGSYNSMTGASGAFYMDVALAVDFSYGLMATKASQNKVGFYIGAGVGYSPLSYSSIDYYTGAIKSSSKTVGIYANLGLRFPALINLSGKNTAPNNVGFYTIVGFNNILIAGLRVGKEFGSVSKKKKGW